MPRDPREWQAELDLQTQLSRAQGSLEIESTFAVLNKLQGGGFAPVYGNASGQEPSHRYPIKIPQAPPGVDIDWNIRRALVSVSYIWFIEHLAPDGEMDYKTINRKRYEDFGNFNYGAVSLAFGLSEEAALRAAGLVQTITDTSRKIFDMKFGNAADHVRSHALDFLGQPPYGDSKRDQEMIKNGFRYFKEEFLAKYSRNEFLREYDLIREKVNSEEWESVGRVPGRVFDSKKYFKWN